MSSKRKDSTDSTNSLLSSVSSMTSFKSFDSTENFYIKNEIKEDVIDPSNNEILFEKRNTKKASSRKRDTYVNTPVPSPSIEKWEKRIKEKNQQDITIKNIADIDNPFEF